MAGVLFAYAIAVPMAMRFLLSFSTDLIAPMITVENYVSFLGTMLFAFGVMFETPFLIFIAVKIGWVTPQGMARKRKLAVVVILIVSAIFTPPDVISQLILAIPLFFLYEAGIFAARRAFGPRKGP